MSKYTSKELLEEWKNKINSQLKSNLSITDWCRENKTSIQQYYYWRDKIYPKPKLNREAFNELNEISEKGRAGIRLEYKGIFINVERGFDGITLKQCFEVLREIKC